LAIAYGTRRERLHGARKNVLDTEVYAENARHFAKLIEQKPGLTMAALAIERVITITS
jgi:hypothetical protein